MILLDQKSVRRNRSETWEDVRSTGEEDEEDSARVRNPRGEVSTTKGQNLSDFRQSREPGTYPDETAQIPAIVPDGIESRRVR